MKFCIELEKGANNNNENQEQTEDDQTGPPVENVSLHKELKR